MFIEKIENKLHIKSRTGQAIFESILIGAFMFIVVFSIFSLLKMAPPSTILKGSLFSAGVGILIGFLNKFAK
jgi:hypothetical protein